MLGKLDVHGPAAGVQHRCDVQTGAEIALVADSLGDLSSAVDDSVQRPAPGSTFGFQDAARIFGKTGKHKSVVAEVRVGGVVVVELRVHLGDVTLVGTEDHTGDGSEFAPATHLKSGSRCHCYPR